MILSSDFEQIPISAFLNFQVLYGLEQMILKDPSCTVQQLIDSTSGRINSVPPLNQFYRPMNPGALFGFLYATLVVPKEMGSPSYFSEFDVNVKDFFDLSPEFSEDEYSVERYESLDFYRIIRNSVAHANFSLTNGSQINMWNARQGIKTIEVMTDVNRLTNFAIAVSNYCIQMRNGK